MGGQSSDKTRLVRFIDAVWNTGDAAAVDHYIADAYTLHHDPGDPWDGQVLDRAAYKDRLRRSRAPFPDQRFAIRDLVAEPGRVVMTWQWTATHRGDLPGFPATGRTVRMSGATVYYVDDGWFTGHWQIADRLGVYGQLRQGRVPDS